MKKHAQLWIIISILAVISAGALFVIAQPKDTTAPSASLPTQNDRPKQERATDTPTPTTSIAKGVYAPYSETAFAAASDKRRILFFHAPWCPQCRALDNDLSSQPLPDNATIFKIDYDTNQALRQKYGVTLQTTFVEIDEEGNKKQSYIAYESPDLESVVKALGL